MNNSNLEFKKIKSLYFLYEINENGTILRNVKSKKNIKIFLDTHHSKSGYYAAFVNIKGVVTRVMIHKVVAECWLGDKPEGYEIDHIDRNSRNNHYSNLRYVNRSEQMKNRVLSDKIIQQGTQNCLNYTLEYVAKPVTIVNSLTGERLNFRSMTMAAGYISNYYSPIYKITQEHIRSKMKKRRSRIFDFDIYYFECRD